MKKLSVLFICTFFCAILAATERVSPSEAASPAPDNLLDRTLRVDYIFSGTGKTAQISLSGMVTWDGWSGRRSHLKELPVLGNGQITMIDSATKDTLYRMSFSTLFQEWQSTPEAKQLNKSFENSFLLPMPKEKADVIVELFDSHKRCNTSFTHTVDPTDILIRRVEAAPAAGMAIDIWHSGSEKEKIDVAIVAEGYTDMGQFIEDARTTVDAILSHEPFTALKDRFNFVAIAVPSKDSGVTVPREGLWRDTAVSSHYDTFYSDRYLTTEAVFKLHNLLAGLPYEHIIILANDNTYGGGGIYNAYTLTTARHPLFRPVVVHEFGHSFAALADEYDYDSGADPMYFPEVEPWEQNITTRHAFGEKWEDMMGNNGVGLFEGAGYQKHNVWRPREDCRMRTNNSPDFCPVCRRAISRIIDFYTTP